MHDRFADHPMTADPSFGTSEPPLWEVVWQRKQHVALGAIVGLALGVLYWLIAPKTYESSAQIWVLKKQPDAPLATDANLSTSASHSDPNADFLGTHQTVIRSAVILGDAIAKGCLSERATFHASSQPTRDLARALTVGRERERSAMVISNNQVLNISFRGTYSEDCVPILSAVIDSYRSFLDRRMRSSARETLELIEKARDLLQNDLETKEKARDEWLSNIPVLWKMAQGASLYQERLGSIDAQRVALGVRIARVRATLAAVNTAVQEGRSRADVLNPAGALSSSLEQELIQLQREEGQLLEDYGPKHPRIQSLRERMQAIRGLLMPSATQATEKADPRGREERTRETLVDLRIAQLKQELAEAESGMASLDTLFQEEMREAKKAFPYEMQEASFRRAISRSQQLYENINQRLKDLSVVNRPDGFEMQLITPPTEAEKIAPRGSLVLPMALFLGLMLGCGMAYIAELTDKRFRSPEDVRRRLGLPIMGVIPRAETKTESLVQSGEGEARLADNLYTWHYASSREAEAYRSVRTSLFFNTNGQGRKIIQITSPNQGDGKSTLAANLAISIAQSAKQVLLINADLRRPRLDRLFRLAHPAGIASVLSGVVKVDDALCATVVPGLFVIPCGPLPPNPSGLLTAPRLREMFEWAK